MDVSWLSVLVAVAVFVSIVLLAAVCLNCRNKSPLVSISQTTASEEHVPHTGFIVIHPSQPHPDHNSIRSPSSLMIPHPNSVDRDSNRRLRPYTPTETESNPSYENPLPGTDFDSEAEDNGYIKVIPEPDPRPTNPSRGSTHSSDSSTDIHQYVNIELDPDSESESNYLNVDDMDHHECYLNVEDTDHHERSTPDLSSRSEDDDDNNDKDDYVNQTPMSHS
ncbi:uncharacterized protein LOC108228485 isoform X2 [Kryptolebias marmoratus]|uniref:uncharacterized protein LOC108228485 isoform X2 n=1 Tax=Kryptolebias marmoratus TaxID=37003 RepID=UPI0018AD077D|nr:uncharacterized protein LOC108228485 isoform X2 [Kryptolebias marmoratus]